jgi:hypothetical protein
MIENKHLEDAWRAFAKAVLPAEASESRRHECRRCFFAGAQNVMGSILPLLEGETGPTRAERTAVYEMIQEINDFAQSRRQERA